MTALAIAQGHGVPDIVARVLAGRGVDAPRRRALPRSDHPRPAARSGIADRHGRGCGKRIAEAIVPSARRSRSSATTTSTARPRRRCSSASSRISASTSEIYIPDRIFEGYGPNPEAMRELVARGARLIVTVDCGTNSAASIDAARRPAPMSSCSTTIRSAVRCRTATRGRQSEPRGRPVRPGASLRGRRGLSRRWCRRRRVLRSRRPKLPRPTCCRCSTSWRWPPSATWCR